MRIVMITENDPAGMGISFCNAINRYSNHQCRLITTAIRYNFMFEHDLHVPSLDQNGYDEIRDILDKADILHFHMLSDEKIILGNVKVTDYMNGKNIIHHHHGHPGFRSNPSKFHKKYKKYKRKSIVSTPDLLKLLPGAAWIPNIVPLYDSLFMPKERFSDGIVRVCQAPTRKELKDTDIFQNVMNSLSLQYDHLEHLIIENTLYSECLKIKQDFDVHFDHMQGYYGVSSLESLSQGKPVIAGLDDWNIKCIKDFTGSEQLPWIVARGKEELYKKLKILINDDGLRRSTGEYSRRFMEKHWTEKHSLSILINQYESL
jgi:hypothetical protein